MRDEGVHPTDAVLLDVLDGVAEGQARRHVAACAECAARVEEARQGLALARQADVPEPSPLYWEDFRSQVGRRDGTDDVDLARPAGLLPRIWIDQRITCRND